MGGYFKPDGALLALNELSGMLGCAAAGGARLVNIPEEAKSQFVAASVQLLRNVGGVNIHSIHAESGRAPM